MNRPDVEVSFDHAFDVAKWLIGKRRFTQAIGLLKQLNAAEPYLIPVLTVLSTALQRVGQVEEAAHGLYRAMVIQPGLSKLHFNLANLWRLRGSLGQAIDRYRLAAELDPEDSELRAGLALALMEAGRWSEGFAEYEWRASRRKFLDRVDRTKIELWRPDLARGKSVLLVSEQGAGDVVQFIRYAKVIADSGFTVHVLCPQNLVRLIATAPGVTSAGAVSPAQFDTIEQIMSLPYRLGVTPDNIEPAVPYLRSPDQPPHQLPPRGRPKIGLVWAGNPRHVRDHLRSCPLRTLVPLIDDDRFEFFSLQFGAKSQEVASHAQRIQNLAPHLRDFADTAAMIAQLDLLISVDTVVAHVAGALGRPVWLLLSASADWRWLTQGQSTAWYPTMRLFRQTRLDDWDGVVAQVHEELWRTYEGAIVPH